MENIKLLDQKSFRTAVTKFKRDGETRQTLIHQLAVSALNLVNENGDTTALTNLHDAFSEAEVGLQSMFRAWVGIFSTPEMIIEETAEGFKPAVQMKARISYSQTDKVFRKAAGLAKGDSLNGSLSDLVELSKNYPLYGFAAFRASQPGSEYQPENSARSVLRTLIRHAENAARNGYPDLAKAFQTGIDALGKGHMAEGKAVVDAVKEELVIRRTSETLKEDGATKH